MHLLTVLRRKPGDSFDAGIVNGPRGRGTLTRLTDDTLAFSFAPSLPAQPADPLTLILGLPRPQTARDVLRDATTLGVAALVFVITEKTEPSYAQSKLWSTGEWRRHVLAGAEQAFDTRVPDVRWGSTLATTLGDLAAGDVRLALDNYESPAPLGQCQLQPGQRVTIAIGGERGWSPAERDTLRGHGFALHHLGARVLRTEVACAAALTLVRAKLGLM